MCSVCGFPNLKGVDDISSDVLQNMVKEYKDKKLGCIRVELLTYDYIIEKGKVVEQSADYVTVCSANELKLQKILWSDMVFEEVPSDRMFKVCIRLVSPDNENTVTLDAEPERAISHGRVGFCLDDGFRLLTAVGNDSNKIYLEAVSLI